MNSKGDLSIFVRKSRGRALLLAIVKELRSQGKLAPGERIYPFLIIVALLHIAHMRGDASIPAIECLPEFQEWVAVDFKSDFLCKGEHRA